MDPIGTACAAVLALAAIYRTALQAPQLLTVGLWVTSLSQLVSALVTTLDPPLMDSTGLANLSQIITYVLMVASSYIFARTTCRVAGLNTLWALVLTWVSIIGMCVVYLLTNLSTTPSLVVETVPGPPSYIFSWLLAAGLLPTHIAAIIGARKGQKNRILFWLFGIYGGVGALYPLLMVLDRIDMYTLRWPLEATYPVVWTIQLISFAALSLAGVVGANQHRRLQAKEGADAR
ncbi:hypothetical protein NJBCHELONAE_48980 [Mycobacteroides chelonae]|uniref:hypothetical protein n=1 Tax=Mycobacteroides chelonae TaxID=1774 RepID=UPI0021DF155D|nr:hypothetical protein [Mycobacteroides chelonae]GLE59585.1 hypothetical protein NJBCHELONAE_48980 [Mycobacteroides chelonae]